MAFDPATAQTLDEFNGQKKTDALVALGYPPNGIKCPQSGEIAHELYDVPGSETKGAVNGTELATIKVFCPIDGYKSERFL